MNESNDLTSHVAEIISAYVAENQVRQDDLPALIQSVHDALAGILKPTPLAVEAPLVPAVPIKRSITDDYIICLEDGARMKTLKRYIGRRFDLTPDQYRTKWGLPPDYPMVAPAYSARRSAMAKEIGLGRKPGVKAPRSKARK